MGRRGRPRKHVTLEEKKAAKKKYNSKYYYKNEEKLTLKRRQKRAAAKEKKDGPDPKCDSAIDSFPKSKSPESSLPSTSPLPPSSPLPSSSPPAGSPYSLSAIEQHLSSGLLIPRMRRPLSSIVVSVPSDSEEGSSHLKRSQPPTTSDYDSDPNDLPSVSSVECSPVTPSTRRAVKRRRLHQ
ncbi:hypothetical protein VKT23_010826 [Stygiomarasmius scandens]|uniref:Uncharacterized protein n=1 Tax=Marasmiellus scandens TaxID=2682957 RepID=A0ABR1JCU0_9AGAR